ncbi:hypothetical protein [Alloalcanivorax xenomutans]|uniref:Uncharacterized protein n=1 Tax=Alloalcanivorax xenomutans TaxID=1094342 RepID=A0A9Q3W924_9GAMM|nr:hypothetical protein [Alloalcanivorax xenomutans]ARB46967.1 hypothetical protein P40_17350 [Alloalcanivorax xenomutans]MCE7511281.1 hypothetical protein [Alloalcanivorax xenomutans]WOD27636.1 hypothetical protein RYH70_16635 [Alloalcanivorax xenomutans]
MDASDARLLLSTHHRLGIPFKYSVLFLLKVEGYPVHQLQKDSRISSPALHTALSGAHWPNDRLRHCLHDRLGLDPFAWGEQNGAWQCRIPEAKRRRRP